MEKTRFCAMLDMSRDGVMLPEKVKEYIDYIAALGYNSLMLYTEDTYEVKDEKLFGFLRGAYTAAEIKDIDAYADKKGVELIPCIQTLAHLNGIFRYGEYARICDTKDILLIGDERTYTLIENMFRTLKEEFKSRTVHIGMDEANMVGRGKYADLHGFQDIYGVMIEHLVRVAEIAKKYGFETLMWSDMFLRVVNGGEYYADNPVTEKIAADMPDNVVPVYWDYYHKEEAEYEKYFGLHDKFKDIWFAGGTWSWSGFVPNLRLALKTTQSAMRVCRKRGVKNIIMTVWGDNGKECSYYTALPVLYYAKQVYEGNEDIELIKRGFNLATGEDFDAFMALELPNKCNKEDELLENQSKYMLYNDPFLGAFDTAVRGNEYDFYTDAAKKLGEYGKKSKSFGYLFEFEKKLCNALAIKYALGADARKNYRAKDKDGLRKTAEDFGKALDALRGFYDEFASLWERENKPNGFEVHIIRLGGLMERLKFCKEKIEKYLKGEIDRIPELENELIDAFGLKDRTTGFVYNSWILNATANVL